MYAHDNWAAMVVGLNTFFMPLVIFSILFCVMEMLANMKYADFFSRCVPLDGIVKKNGPTKPFCFQSHFFFFSFFFRQYFLHTKTVLYFDSIFLGTLYAYCVMCIILFVRFLFIYLFFLFLFFRCSLSNCSILNKDGRI